MAIMDGYGGEHRRGGISLYGALSVAFVLVFGVQLYRSMSIDAFELTSSRLDLAGFAICQAIGLVLVLRAVVHGRLMPDVPLLCIVLLGYIAIIVTATAIDASLLALMLSRYGIFTWFLLGLGTAAAASYIHLPLGTPQARLQRRLFLLVAGILGLLLTSFSLTYLSAPAYTPSYQAVANNLITILLVIMIFTQIIWDGKVPLPVLVGVVAIGTLATTAVARMQSTSIVGFWIIGLVIYFWSTLRKLPFRYQMLAILGGTAATAVFLSSDLFKQTLQHTRFADLLAGGGLSSIDGRLDLLHDFGRQFVVSPIFGNFAAEVHAGSGFGNYPHTLASFLTHTGLLGTCLLGVILVLILSRRLPVSRLSQPDLQQVMFMAAVLAMGLAYTFMTWSVFWFMLGFMCKMPIARVGRTG